MNYQIEMEKEIDKNQKEGKLPTILLHSCCGPCSSYVLECLTKYFKVTIVYYNPNIYPSFEYEKRLGEQRKIIELLPVKNRVDILEVDYDHNEYLSKVVGMEEEKEGGNRCHICYRLRLEKTAILAKENNFDYFGTTLSVSPYKNAKVLNEIGKELEEKYNIKYLCSDFKKKEGYKRSIELSKEYDLYRQDYCGCEFSMPKINV